MSDGETRCVLLAPEGNCAEASRLLEHRGWTAQVCGDPLAAMAELCLLERTLATRREWGLETVEQIALVVADPDRWRQLPEMLAAARRYLPQAAVWACTDGTLQPLFAAQDSQRRPPKATRSNDIDVDPVSKSGATDVSSPSISPEEIEMLLDNDHRQETE
jgi:hypothetical protein